MMSKSSFWANFRENLKRRGWTALLCVLTMFLALPVRGAMQISANQQKLRTNRVFLDASRTPADWLKERFLYETVCDTTLLVVFLVLAILLAVQGFSWLDNRRKLDMYLSVPIPSRRRYAVIYGNGVGIRALISRLPADNASGWFSDGSWLGEKCFFMRCWYMCAIWSIFSRSTI